MEEELIVIHSMYPQNSNQAEISFSSCNCNELKNYMNDIKNKAALTNIYNINECCIDVYSHCFEYCSF